MLLSLTNTSLSITTKLEAFHTFTAVGSGLVVADGVGTADIRRLSAFINICRNKEINTSFTFKATLCKIWGFGALSGGNV